MAGWGGSKISFFLEYGPQCDGMKVFDDRKNIYKYNIKTRLLGRPQPQMGGGGGGVYQDLNSKI